MAYNKINGLLQNDALVSVLWLDVWYMCGQQCSVAVGWVTSNILTLLFQFRVVDQDGVTSHKQNRLNSTTNSRVVACNRWITIMVVLKQEHKGWHINILARLGNLILSQLTEVFQVGNVCCYESNQKTQLSDWPCGIWCNMKMLILR